MVMTVINAKVVVEELLDQPVSPTLLRDLLPRVVLGGPHLHRFQFRQGRLPGRRVLGTVLDNQVLQQVGTFQRDATARGLLGLLTEI